jgi:DNA-directed RNA polymerase subunit beta'
VYEVPAAARLHVENEQTVRAGEALTEGPMNPHRILGILGREAAQTYLLEEIQKVYRSQGVNINDKHIEMILRQMFRKVRVKSTGDTEFLPGQLIDRLAFEDVNQQIVEQGGHPATAQSVLLGVTKAALNTESFLAASSFQHTISVLSQAATEGKRDDLYGLKENVIIGKLIPAGTGFRNRQHAEMTGAIDRLGKREHMLDEDIQLEDEELAVVEEVEAEFAGLVDSEEPTAEEGETAEAEPTARAETEEPEAGEMPEEPGHATDEELEVEVEEEKTGGASIELEEDELEDEDEDEEDEEEE